MEAGIPITVELYRLGPPHVTHTRSFSIITYLSIDLFYNLLEEYFRINLQYSLVYSIHFYYQAYLEKHNL